MMYREIVLLFLWIAFAGNLKADELSLWYRQPASNWNEALPIGNGHIGAMVFGGIEEERLQINENTLYSGDPATVYKDVRITPRTFYEVTKLIREEKYAEATLMVRNNWLGRLHQCYQPCVDLYIKDNVHGETSDYVRKLDIGKAVHQVSYIKNGTRYTRRVFASNPDRVLVMHYQSAAPKGLDLTLRFTSQHPTARMTAEGTELLMKGQAPGFICRRTFKQIEEMGDEYKHPELYDEQGKQRMKTNVLYGEDIGNRGMFFESRILPVLPDGGTCQVTPEGIRVSGTDNVYFIISVATSFNGYDKDPVKEGLDPSQLNKETIAKAGQKTLDELSVRHLTDYESLFGRVSLKLHSDAAQLKLPTDERIIRFSQKNDPDLVALLFQYGRYLMISGSRTGGQPLNLQGMWNNDIVPAWNSAYTTNINLEMNYWPSETTNLSDCTAPLFDMIQELSVTGTETARKMYNNRGWVFHHNTSIWRETFPNDRITRAAFWPMGSGWLCSHLWEHYAFTCDKAFLEYTAYPLMKSASEFYLDWLVKDESGYWMTPVAVSPENKFRFDGKECHVSKGSTMDLAIIRELFGRTLEASRILGKEDDAVCKEIRERMAGLWPYRIGNKGQLLEWDKEFEEMEPEHRHLSHLYGFHPGNQITPLQTPDLFNAVRKTLELRGDEATGWSMGWKVNCWARMLDGNHAHKIIANMFNPIDFGPNPGRGGGLYANLLDACPPFEIDGNFGFTSGVTEMLLQSHAGFIHLLPALPDVWSQGEVKGLKARGNFTVSMRWNRNKLAGAELVSHVGEKCTLVSAIPFRVRCGKQFVQSKPLTMDGKQYWRADFPTEAGKRYRIELTKHMI